MTTTETDSKQKLNSQSYSQSTRSVMIFAGPSGGHLYPAIAFSEAYLKKYPGSKMVLVTTQRADRIIRKYCPQSFQKYHYLSEFPYPGGNLLKAPLFLLKLFQAFIQSSKLLSQETPNLCVGFGSFVSFPGLWLASKRKIPTVIHEQNVIPGKATRWLASNVDHVTTSFDTTSNYLNGVSGICVGLPLREELVGAARQKLQKQTSELDESQSKKRILVFGGSQGAESINRIFFETLERLSSEEKSKMAVIHITGDNEFERFQEKYSQIEIEHQIYPFCDRMQDLYGVANMAMTRGGANTLSELRLFGIPALVVPYPHAASHQSENVQYFESQNLIRSCEQSAFNADWLLNQLRGFLKGMLFPENSSVSQAESSLQAAGQLVAVTEKALKGA